jgi:hypothetical protein
MTVYDRVWGVYGAYMGRTWALFPGREPGKAEKMTKSWNDKIME